MEINRQAQRFVVTWTITCAAVAASAALFILLMDPYLIFNTPRIAGLNARKPAEIQQERLVKAYDVTRSAPTTVLLGSSRTDMGFTTRSSPRPHDDPVIYNLGFGSGTPYMAYRYLQHVLSRHKPSSVVMGLDFEYFLTADRDPRGTEAFESYLSITRDGQANPDGRWQSLASIEGLVGSFMTLSSNLRDEAAWDFISAGNWDFKTTRESVLAAGSYPRVVMADVIFARSHLNNRHARLDPAVLDDLRDILDLCASRNVRVVLFISPVHADMLEIIDLAGFWGKFEDWKREIVALAAHYDRTDSDNRLALWDFSGYHTFAIEAVSETRTLRWFWESSHYTPELGDLMLRQMQGASDDGFGTLLLPEMLESHLLSIREQRQRYRDQHAPEVTRIQKLYDAVARRLQSENGMPPDDEHAAWGSIR